MSVDYDKLKNLLESPFKAAPDVKVDKDKDIDVDIFMINNEILDNGELNAGILCIGRYDLKGDGKKTISEILTNNLEEIKNSILFYGVDALIESNFIDDNIIFVSGDHQYFISDRKVVRRNDAAMFASRMPKIGDDGYLITSKFGMSEIGIIDEPKAVGKTAWMFPGVSWKQVEGIFNPNPGIRITAVADADSVSKIMVPSSLGSDIGKITKLNPIYIKGIEQQNHLSMYEGIVMRSRFDSKEDELVDIEQIAIVRRTPNNEFVSTTTFRPEVKAKTDYWNGEILRISFTMNDNPFGPPTMDDRSRISIDDELSDNSKVVKILSGNPTGVIRPLLLTAFKDKKPTLYSASDYDIMIDKILTTGIIKKFRLILPDGTEEKPISYDFAIVGDLSGVGIKPVETMDISESMKFHEKLGEYAKKNYKNIIIDAIKINDEPEIKTGDVTQANRIIRKIVVSRFNHDMIPQEIEIETDTGSESFRFTGENAIRSLRFTVPDNKRVKEIEDAYKDIEKQMEQKAKIVADKLKDSRGGFFKDMHEYMSKAVTFIGPEGVSGTTMVNVDNLIQGKDLVLEGI